MLVGSNRRVVLIGRTLFSFNRVLLFSVWTSCFTAARSAYGFAFDSKISVRRPEYAFSKAVILSMQRFDCGTV